MSHILVLNPNSSAEVTAAMEASVAPFAARLGHPLRFETLVAGPPAIETEADIAAAAPLVAERAATAGAAAVVVACFSDPGVEAARAAARCPVIGIGAAGYLAALALAPRFGVVSILPASIPRHAAHLARLGLAGRCAGDRAIGFGVAALAGAAAREAIVTVGRALRDADGAGTVVLGCAGMGRHRPALEAALGLPVVDPVQAAVVQAAGMLTLGYAGSHAGGDTGAGQPAAAGGEGCA